MSRGINQGGGNGELSAICTSPHLKHRKTLFAQREAKNKLSFGLKKSQHQHCRSMMMKTSRWRLSGADFFFLLE